MKQQEERLQQALDQFLAAFRELAWARFIAAFAADASVFFPFADAPRRADGVEEIEAVFAPFFASLRSRQTHLQLDPVDVQIDICGTLALVSFHLHDSVDDQAILCRRTMVWIDDGAQWRILHLHASNLIAPP